MLIIESAATASAPAMPAHSAHGASGRPRKTLITPEF